MSAAQHEIESPPSDAISSVAFSPSDQLLAVGSWDRTVSVYERSDGGDAPFTFSGTRIKCRAPVLDIAWGADDQTLYAVGLDWVVREILTGSGSEAQGEEGEDGADHRILSSRTAASNKVAYSASQNVLVSTSWDGTMHVHDPQDGAYVSIMLPAKPYALSLTADKAIVAMAERKMSVYDLHTLKALVEQADSTKNPQQPLQVEPWQQRESSLKFMTRAVATMPDGTGFATSSIEGRVGVEWFDPELQKQAYAFKCHRRTTTVPGEDGEEAREIDVVYPVNALAFHPVYGTFVTGGGDGVVALWDAQTKRRVRQYQKLGASVAAMEFSGDGKFLAIGVCPGFEEGKEDEEVDTALVKVVVRELGESEAKGKAAK